MSEREATEAGEVGVLLYDHRKNALTCYDHPEAYCCVCGSHEVGSYRSHLATVLAARDARVRREGEADGLRAAATEIETEGPLSKAGFERRRTLRILRDRADRITP